MINRQKPKTKKTAFLIIPLFLFAGGCATIVHGTKQTVFINSNPPGAIATIGGNHVLTPGAVSLSKSKDYTVVMEKDGYEPGYAYIRRNLNGYAAVLGNILWLVPGLTLDVITGGAWTLEPEKIEITLLQKTAAGQTEGQNTE